MCMHNLFGYDVDDLFAYQTQKVVRIRDRRLGFVYYTLLFIIGIYVVGYQILYKNEHFKKFDVFGDVRLGIQQPTRGCNPKHPDCLSNFHSLMDLPYCDMYDGNSNVVLPKYRHQCIFADQHSLMPDGVSGTQMFVPTMINQLVERQNCTPTVANNYTCDNEYTVENRTESVYVADIERYTILLAHSYHRGKYIGHNGQTQGYYEVCLDDPTVPEGLQEVKDFLDFRECRGTIERRPILRENSKSKLSTSFLSKKKHGRSRLHQRRAAQLLQAGDSLARDNADEQDMARPNVSEWEVPGVYTIPGGDVFTISQLLKLSGLSLDSNPNRSFDPTRMVGGAIEVYVSYENLRPFASSFGLSEVSYTYKIKKRPVHQMKKEFLAKEQPNNYPLTRFVEDHHGLLISVTIGGSFGFFSMIYTLIMLSTAAGMFGAAVFITDNLALHVLKDRESYRTAKFEETEDYSERQDFEIFGHKMQPEAQASSSA